MIDALIGVHIHAERAPPEAAARSLVRTNRTLGSERVEADHEHI